MREEKCNNLNKRIKKSFKRFKSNGRRISKKKKIKRRDKERKKREEGEELKRVMKTMGLLKITIHKMTLGI